MRRDKVPTHLTPYERYLTIEALNNTGAKSLAETIRISESEARHERMMIEQALRHNAERNGA